MSRRLLVILAAAVLACPLAASAHGSEFMLAKVGITRSGECVLEVTADYGGNPMIGSEDEARASLNGLLQIKSNGRVQELSELAVPIVEKHDHLDPTTPAFQPDMEQEHKLVVGRWRWQPQTADFTFQIPKGNPNAVLMWTANEKVPLEKPRWVIMIAGDESPVIHVPQNLGGWIWFAVCGVFGASAFVLYKLRCQFMKIGRATLKLEVAAPE